MALETPSQLPSRARGQRILACVLCQQRKVKCDRNFPCTNCVKYRQQCVPSKLSQPRRRRKFPERALLERLDKYEALLRQNNVEFEPLHDTGNGEQELVYTENKDHGQNEYNEHRESMKIDARSSSPSIRSEISFAPKNAWQAMSQRYQDDDDDDGSSEDDVHESTVRNALDQSISGDDYLLFGSQHINADMPSLHGDPVQIFRLWQIYLDNVSPLLRVTHTPTLQIRIIEAAGHTATIDPNLEALMFSIYCMSVQSLDAEECLTILGSSKDELLRKYQSGCQQALSNCQFLRSSDRDCLTALYFFLSSIRPSTTPQALSSMLAIAIRIAQRMGIHSESTLGTCTPFEAELRRRLWWSLMLFDTRINETTGSRVRVLDPTWDCNIPSNVNDPDLRPEMKGLVFQSVGSTEGIFATVRSRIGNFIRNSEFHLDFLNPALKPIVQHMQNNLALESNRVANLEQIIEEQYLSICDQENPVHFMTIWASRAYLAKCRLLEHIAMYTDSPVRQTDLQLDRATAYAIRMLECDNKVMTSPLTRRFRWFSHAYFPFPAYMQIMQDLRKRPMSPNACQAWEVMSDNYDAWMGIQRRDDMLFHQIFGNFVLRAWEARDDLARRSGESLRPPRIVTSIRQTLRSDPSNAKAETPSTDANMGMDEFTVPRPLKVDDQSLPYSLGWQTMGPVYSSNGLGRMPSDSQIDQLDWTTFGGWPGWGGC